MFVFQKKAGGSWDGLLECKAEGASQLIISANSSLAGLLCKDHTYEKYEVRVATPAKAGWSTVGSSRWTTQNETVYDLFKNRKRC